MSPNANSAQKKADRKVKKLQGRGADYSSSSDEDGDDEWEAESTEAPSQSDSARGYSSSAFSGSSNGSTPFVVRQKPQSSGFRGMSEQALNEHLEIEVDKLRAARVWKYMFLPVPVELEQQYGPTGGNYKNIVASR